jgi:RsiW-degrading membrane proteinase PrsW (M82 family)
MGVIASLLFGFFPMYLNALFIYWLDHYEKEPKFLLGLVFFWGAVLAAGIAFFLNTAFGVGVFMATNSESAADFSTGAISAPLIEETMKGLAVLVVFLFAHKEFDSVLDGIVYAAVAALGFAATENTYYIYAYGFEPDGWAGLFNMVFIRVILVGWQHPFYTAFIGIGLALARFQKNWGLRIFLPSLGWFIAVILHSIHNIIATVSPGPFGLLLGTTLDWMGWSAMLLFILIIINKEKSLIEKLIINNPEVFHPQDQYVKSITNFSKRIGYSVQFLGTKKSGAYAQFIKLVPELAHKVNQAKITDGLLYKDIIIDLTKKIKSSLIELNT